MPSTCEEARTWNRSAAIAGVLATALFAGSVLWSLEFLRSAEALPYGGWDAWNIWNLRAKYLAGPVSAWHNTYSPGLNYFSSHPNYPLLLSAIVGAIWRFTGVNSLVPIAVAALFEAGVLFLLIGAIAKFRGAVPGMLAGLLLIATASFMAQGPMQQADVPLSFFYLSTLICFSLAACGNRRAAVCGGCCASLAAWTKNEGLVFMVLALACYGAASIRWNEVAAWFLPLVGAAPGSLSLAYFKVFLAPPGDLPGHQTATALFSKLADPGRYAMIGEAVIAGALRGRWWSNPILLMAILALGVGIESGARLKRAAILDSAILAGIALSYCGTYLVTPMDLHFHILTSIVRLYSQLWPSVLFIFFLVMRNPENA